MYSRGVGAVSVTAEVSLVAKNSKKKVCSAESATYKQQANGSCANGEAAALTLHILIDTALAISSSTGTLLDIRTTPGMDPKVGLPASGLCTRSTVLIVQQSQFGAPKTNSKIAFPA